MTGALFLLLFLVPAVLAVTVHEIAHGRMALALGDPTAAAAGRLSLNPLRHIDAVGTLLVPIGLYLLGTLAFGTVIFFGWAKPVPVTWSRLSPRRAGLAAVAAAGPGANLFMLLGWAAARAVLDLAGAGGSALIYMCEVGIIFNAAIMIINLLPIPPLDGSRIVSALLPPAWAARYNRLEPYGLLIVLALVASGLLQRLVAPPIALLRDVFGG